MAGIPGHSGGSRLGAGRKSIARHQHLEPILEQIDERLQSTLEERLNALEQLAQGGCRVITERWEMAGTLFTDAVRELLDAEGNPTGHTMPCKWPLFPDKPTDQLVLVSRTVKILPPNLAANIYLINRLLGNVKSGVKILEIAAQFSLLRRSLSSLLGSVCFPFRANRTIETRIGLTPIGVTAYIMDQVA